MDAVREEDEQNKGGQVIRVWHRVQPNFLGDVNEATEAWGVPGSFELVAELENSGDKEWAEEDWAFYRTNSIDHPWTSHPDVKPVRRKLRSTSVGDVVQVSNGRLLLCMSAGWEEIPFSMTPEQQQEVRRLHESDHLSEAKLL